MRFESGAEPKGLVTLPTGTVTFLFSDIEGSTQRWEQHPVAMKAAVARHEQLMSNAIKQNGGYIFKSLGDAFCAAFPIAPQAINAAVDAQRDLAKEDFTSVDGLRVRMGLHTGYAEERNADYFGPAVNRVARLMSIGHGGQILIAGVTRDLAYRDLPNGVSLLDLGLQRLKDLSEAERLWQLTLDGLPSEFPPLKSLDTIPNNLPIQPTSFRGREHDLSDVKKLVAEHRLLTLFGAGGIGKTRLAMQVGAEVLDQYPDGVWLADLATITAPELVSSVIAQVLGMSQVEGRKVDESLPQWLRRKNLLLILDNCEHLLESVASITDAIMRQCPDVRMLATSRQALGISGERVFRLASLDVPSENADLTPEAAMQFGAVALFVDRALFVDKSFTLTSDITPIVAEICRRLDGIPLAIELAAARVKVLSVPNLAQRLNERFKILTGGSRFALPRQKTLSALIDWSYDLLTTQEQVLFARTSIFAGGFSLDAATAVCGGGGINEANILDLLSSLVDKSLVVADTRGKRERYFLLESTRAYALKKLAEDGRDQLSRRYAEYFLELAQEADRAFSAITRREYLARVEPDVDNYRSVLDWSLARGNDVILGAALAGQLQMLWFFGGLRAEGWRWIEKSRASLDEAAHPSIAAKLWRALAMMSSGKHQHHAAERARNLYDSVGDAHNAAWARFLLSYALKQMGHTAEASDNIARALADMQESDDKQGIAVCLNLQAGILWPTGDVERARDLYAQAIELFKLLGDQLGLAVPLNNLAELEFAQGNAELALRYQRERAVIDAFSKNSFNLAIARNDTAAYLIALGNLHEARQAAQDALATAQEAQYKVQVAVAAIHLAHIAALNGEGRRAARLVGYVDATYRDLDLQREAAEKWSYEKLTEALRELLSEAEIEQLINEGAAWSEDQAADEALKI